MTTQAQSTQLPRQDPGGVLVMREPGGQWDAPACICTGTWHPQCCYGARVPGIFHLSCCGGRVRTYRFTRSKFCTPSCGTSHFEDWAHTPLCEKRYEAAAQAEDLALVCGWCGWDETDGMHAEDCGR